MHDRISGGHLGVHKTTDKSISDSVCFIFTGIQEFWIVLDKFIKQGKF